MKIDVKVPSMGESINEVTIGQLLKEEGSLVKTDDELLEIETDKVNQVIYAPQAGVVNFLVKANDRVKIDQTVASIETDGKVNDKSESKKRVDAAPEKIESDKSPQIISPISPLKASVEARYTKESFINDLKEGEKPAEIIKSKNEPQEKKIEPNQTIINKELKRETRRKMTRVRKVIAMRMVEALQTTAMLTTFNEVDLSQVMALREKYKESFIKAHGVKLGIMPFFIKAVMSALHEFPDLNSYIDGDEIVHRNYYDIGVAVGTERGVFVPVIRNCDQMTFVDLEKAIERYGIQAREASLSVDDLQGGGFTITNGGVYGSLLSTPILNPPQSGILGMHNIVKRPIALDDQVVIRPMMYLALSYDHRIVDGKEAVSFLIHIKRYLEDLAHLVLET